MPPRVPLRLATYRPSLSTSGRSSPRWMPPPTSLVAALLQSASPPLAPVLRSRAEAGAPRISPMGAASATTSRVSPTMARRLLSTIPCPRMHAPADIIPSTYDSTPARPRLQPYTPPTYTPPRSCLHAPARQPPCRFTLLPPRLSIRLSAPPRPTCTHTCTRAHASRQAASWVAATRLSPADRAARGTTRPRAPVRRSTPFATRRMGWSAAGSAGAAMCARVVYYMVASCVCTVHCIALLGAFHSAPCIT